MALHLLPHICLLTILSLLLSASSQPPFRCHPNEKDALLRLQTICGFAGNSEPDCCSWPDVKCDPTTGNVIELYNLGSCFGSTPLFPNSPIFELRRLRSLYATNCSIPSEIDKLAELQDITVNIFHGPIPSSIGNLRNLKSLALRSGSSAGSFPPTIGGLAKLETLDLSGNHLTGPLPGSIFRLPNLTYVALQFNDLTGSIPEFVGNLTKLEILDLRYNRLSGPLPASVFRLPNLKSLYVSSNRLTGQLARSVVPGSKLKDLYLDGNMFTGNVPSWLFTASLENLFASRNRLSGRIEPFPPPKVSYLSNVQISDNLIEGVPNSLFLLKNISNLILAGNRLSGELNIGAIQKMESLSILDLSSNKGLSLVNNNKGPLRLSSAVSYLGFGNCNLTKFPDFLSVLPNLRDLRVNNNNIKGGFKLGKGWASLILLDASFNFLEGSLPAAVPLSLEILRLSHNNLVGDAPGSLCRLTELDLSFNKLNGGVSKSCSGGILLKTLNLRNNELHGLIPSSIGKFLNLQYLDLSSNKLSGKVPKELMSLKSLKYLNLSYNAGLCGPPLSKLC